MEFGLPISLIRIGCKAGQIVLYVLFRLFTLTCGSCCNRIVKYVFSQVLTAFDTFDRNVKMIGSRVRFLQN